MPAATPGQGFLSVFSSSNEIQQSSASSFDPTKNASQRALSTEKQTKKLSAFGVSGQTLSNDSFKKLSNKNKKRSMPSQVADSHSLPFLSRQNSSSVVSDDESFQAQQDEEA